MKTNVVPFIEL